MKRTELLEIRKMCFEEAWLGWDSAADAGVALTGAGG